MHHVSCDHHPQENIFSDKPRLRLTLGRTLNPSEIKVTGSFLSCFVSNLTNIQEGDDVYFECRIVSNPEATKLEWYHEASFDINFTLCQHKLYLSLLQHCPDSRSRDWCRMHRGASFSPISPSLSRYHHPIEDQKGISRTEQNKENYLSGSEEKEQRGVHLPGPEQSGRGH